MTSPAWRTVTIGALHRLCCRDGQMMVQHQDGTSIAIPLFDVRTVLITSTQVSLTAALINELQKLHIQLIFCNEKCLPSGEFVGYYDHHAAAQHIQEQASWKKKYCREVWKQIVRMKMLMQKTLLQRLSLESNWNKWQKYLDSLKAGDTSNREGQAARLYFNALFGKDFQRREESSINRILNYGYAIICSAMTRALTAHGYHPSLGIAHRGGTNSLNLSYDFLEPFRPFVDEIAWLHRGEELGKELKHELINVTNQVICYQGVHMPIASVMEQYVMDMTHQLSSGITFSIQLGWAACEIPS